MTPNPIRQRWQAGKPALGTWSQIAVVWAARRVGRPVKWTGDRTEAFLTDYNARDVVTRARLGFLVDVGLDWPDGPWRGRFDSAHRQGR